MEKDIRIPSVWSFESKEVADGFDRHVRGQLPWYEMLSAACGYLAENYIFEGATVYELGASTGHFSRPLKECVEARRARYVPIEKSREMAANYSGIGGLIVADIRDIEFQKFSLCVSFLTLMFLPRSDRVKVIKKLADAVQIGGAILLVDKFEPPSGYPGILVNRLNAVLKDRITKLPREEILSKEFSLCGYQIPIKYEELDGLGLTKILFFKFGDFEGWLLLKN